jgi:hypothetical protein
MQSEAKVPATWFEIVGPEAHAELVRRATETIAKLESQLASEKANLEFIRTMTEGTCQTTE